MSQKVTRAAGVPADEKEKRQTDSPARDVKKKMAANADKEKAAVEKQNGEKSDKNTKTDKVDNKKDKVAEKQNGDRVDKKKTDKPTDSKNSEQEKVKEDAVKNGKADKDEAAKKATAPKQNGAKTNGAVNGNGTVSDDDTDEDVDEVFPELAYDDDTSNDGIESRTPDCQSRSFTRRSQVKNTRTPETPQPAIEKAAEVTSADKDHPKETKLLKLKDDIPSTTTPSTDRILRSTDSPKKTDVAEDSPKKLPDSSKSDDKAEKSVPLVLLEDCEASSGESRKPDTNFSKSRVKVSPYRRSGRIADHSANSLLANYTGNNTTMEMDITESSSFIERPSLLDEQTDEATSSYINGLRNIKGRRSYKQLKEINIRSIGANRSLREKAVNVSATSSSDRPTGTVVGRKRKQEPFTSSANEVETAERVERAERAERVERAEDVVASKRARLLQVMMSPLRKVYSSTPLPMRRAAPIVGINTDLPLSAPVSSASFDPESLKTAEPLPVTADNGNPDTVTADKADTKRCAIM